MKAKAWAVVDGGEIVVSSVSPKRLTAIMNWLATERACMIWQKDSDEKIEATWQSMKLNVECLEVEVSTL